MRRPTGLQLAIVAMEQNLTIMVLIEFVFFFNGHPIQPPVMKRNCPWQLHTAEHRSMAVTSRTTSPLILRPQQKSSKVKDQVVPKSGLSAAYQLRHFSIFTLLVEQMNPIIPG